MEGWRRASIRRQAEALPDCIPRHMGGLACAAMALLLPATAAHVVGGATHPLASMRTPPCTCCATPEQDSSWRLDRARLTQQWSKSVLSRPRRFLPFIQARQWARAMHMEDETDWRDWIADGEKRNPYVPSNPDVVYDSEWAGWHDFLNGPIEDASITSREDYKRGKWLQGPLSEKDS